MRILHIGWLSTNCLWKLEEPKIFDHIYEITPQWSWAVSQGEKKCQLSLLNTKVFTLPKGQNKPLIKIFYLAVFILVTDLQFSL